MDWRGGGRSGDGWLGAWGGEKQETGEKEKATSVRECTQSEKGRKVTREPWAPSAQTLRIKATGD